MTDPRLTSYEGDTLNGKPHGIGKSTYIDNGMVYEGEFFNGKPQGKGKIMFPNGDVYEGEFYNDRLHGKGKMIYADGTVEEQMWDYGKKAGVKHERI